MTIPFDMSRAMREAPFEESKRRGEKRTYQDCLNTALSHEHERQQLAQADEDFMKTIATDDDAKQ